MPPKAVKKAPSSKQQKPASKVTAKEKPGKKASIATKGST